MDVFNNFNKNVYKNIFGGNQKSNTTNQSTKAEPNPKNIKNTEQKTNKSSKEKEIEDKSTLSNNDINFPEKAKSSNLAMPKTKEAVMTGLFGDYSNINKKKQPVTNANSNTNVNPLNENAMTNIFGNISNININKKKQNNPTSSTENQNALNQMPVSNSLNTPNENNENQNIKQKPVSNINKASNQNLEKNELGLPYKIGDLYSDTNLIREKLGIMESEAIRDISKASLNVPDQKYIGVLVLTDFRLIFHIEHEENLIYNYSEDYFKIPLFRISKVEKIQDKKLSYDAIPIEITLKDTRVIKFHLYNLQRFYFNLTMATNREDCKQFFDFAKKYNKTHFKGKNLTNGWNIYDPIIEFSRQGVIEGNDLGLRYCYVNKDFKMCATYPEFLIEPSNITDEQLKQSSNYRTKGRLPIFTYYYYNDNDDNINTETKVTPSIWRSAQNKRGLVGNKTCEADVEILNSISRFGGEQGKLYIYDCRPKINAIVNRVGGGGYEKEGDYDNATLCFCEIDNIHKARKALNAMYSLCLSNKINDYNNFWTSLEQTDWYQFIYLMLKYANEISKTLQSNHSVLIHCSDGWDRTAQLSSLSQLLLDPFYRTINGFAVLIEKDWLSFGHQFGLRNGFSDKEKQDQASPIFLQFLDAVHQLLEQFPNAFEFNEKLLLFLAKNYSINLYGTFLYNNEKERKEQNAKTETASVWTEIFRDLNPYLNIYYDSNSVKILEPNYSYYNLKLWTSLFMENNIYLENKHFYVSDMDKSIAFKTKQEFYAYKKKQDENKFINYQTKYDEILKVMAECYYLDKDNKSIFDKLSKESKKIIDELKTEMDKINRKRIVEKELEDKMKMKKDDINKEEKEETRKNDDNTKEEKKEENKEINEGIKDKEETKILKENENENITSSPMINDIKEEKKEEEKNEEKKKEEKKEEDKMEEAKTEEKKEKEEKQSPKKGEDTNEEKKEDNKDQEKNTSEVKKEDINNEEKEGDINNKESILENEQSKNNEF